MKNYLTINEWEDYLKRWDTLTDDETSHLKGLADSWGTCPTGSLLRARGVDPDELVGMGDRDLEDLGVHEYWNQTGVDFLEWVLGDEPDEALGELDRMVAYAKELDD